MRYLSEAWRQIERAERRPGRYAVTGTDDLGGIHLRRSLRVRLMRRASTAVPNCRREMLPGDSPGNSSYPIRAHACGVGLPHMPQPCAGSILYVCTLRASYTLMA